MQDWTAPLRSEGESLPLHGAGRVGWTKNSARFIPVRCTIRQLLRSFRFPNDRFGFICFHCRFFFSAVAIEVPLALLHFGTQFGNILTITAQAEGAVRWLWATRTLRPDRDATMKQEIVLLGANPMLRVTLVPEKDLKAFLWGNKRIKNLKY